MKSPTIKSVRNKCDKLLSPIIIKLYPRCLLCGGQTQVFHHHKHKSSSTRLRYEIENGIPLCNSCHYKLHQNESYWASKIVDIKGLDWFRKLDKLGTEIVKADVHFYLAQYERLKKMLDKLNCG